MIVIIGLLLKEEYSNKDITSSDLDMKSIQGAFKNAWKDTSLWKF